MIRSLLLLLALLVQGIQASWTIGEPSKSFGGPTVKLDYPVSAGRKPEEVDVLFYKDEECSEPFTEFGSDRPYFTVDVYKGVGQTISVVIFMETQRISEIVNEVNGQSCIAYCVRFQFRDLSTSEIMNKSDNEIIVGVDLKDNIGITGFLEDCVGDNLDDFEDLFLGSMSM